MGTAKLRRAANAELKFDQSDEAKPTQILTETNSILVKLSNG